MKILALDLGKFNSVACFFNSKTRKPKFLTTPTNREHIASIFKSAKADLVVMEACGPSGWINDLAQSFGLETLVCSTNEEAWRWANVKRKTDRDDALKLARMAAMGELKAVHTPSPQHREFRSLVKYRKTLDQRINKTKNTIRAWFVNHGIEIASGEKAWYTGREKINSFRKPLVECDADELWKGELDIELTILDSLTEQLDGVVKKLEAIGKTDERVRRVQTIPGVGPRTAEILVACIDDPHRFDNGRQVSAYFGLVPRQYQSGETDRNGRITKRGNPLARTILVECAWASLRYNPWAKGVYERICGKQKTRKKKAAIALARKLAVIAWALLRDERDWNPAQMIAVTKSYDGKLPIDEAELAAMPKKECRHKRKRRLAKEAKASKEAKSSQTTGRKQALATENRSTSSNQPSAATRSTRTQRPTKRTSQTRNRPPRARKPVTPA
ncbi:IS110 family transposase [Novipirellula rosea]|uniref:Transposase IS116/IS110/IS902 family protein n=1 Tax=Novipirellula rosea TaxID=1031540 RepID=A0ABP8M7W8_9BACT